MKNGICTCANIGETVQEGACACANTGETVKNGVFPLISQRIPEVLLYLDCFC